LQAAVEVPRLVAVVATLSKGYDLDYVWTHVNRGPVKDAASYYLRPARPAGSRLAAGGARAQRPPASAKGGGLSVNMIEKSRPRSMQSRSSTAYFRDFATIPAG
jgi:hypothetical protein